MENENRRADGWKLYHTQNNGSGIALASINNRNTEDRPSYVTAAENSLAPGKNGMTRSRTLGVLSSISRTFSRGSLNSRTTDRSRDFSGSSISTTLVSKPSLLSLSRFSRKSSGPAAGNEADVEPAEWPLFSRLQIADDPRMIIKAMPAQYWAGRFMALQDQFRSELLENRNLNAVIEAQVARSSLCGNSNAGYDTPAKVNTLNNPSTSVYAAARIAPRDSYGGYQRGDNQDGGGAIKRHSRIPHAATSGAILETPRGDGASYPKASTPPQLRQAPTRQPTPRLPSYDQAIAMPPLRLAHRRETNPDDFRSNPYNNTDALRALVLANAAALTDEDSRIRRVFVHLEALCMTDEARFSLHLWQQEYARQMKRETFLPPGGTMVDAPRKTSGGITGRLEGFFGGGPRRSFRWAGKGVPKRGPNRHREHFPRGFH